MLDWFLIILALAAGGGGSMPGGTMSTGSATVAPEAPGLVAEPQVPTGKFTTATEVKPILTATKANWVAIRDYDGQDLLYVTHLLAWRCGLDAIFFSVNGGAEERWKTEPCYEGEATPNAQKGQAFLPFNSYPLGSVASLSVRIVFDDGTEDAAKYQRKAVLMP